MAEKRPLSNTAIAGFYYFKSGSVFVEMAKAAVLKGSSYQGQFYISAVLNEYILNNMKVMAYQIEPSQYHSFYSPDKVNQYESQIRLGRKNEKL